MTDNETLVSIITPTYNCAPFIAETILSVQAQTYSEWEMIIVDDCSTDNTAEVVAPFMAQDPRIRYIKNDTNLGAAQTRNRALREARGRWIAFLDSDDVWRPDKLQCQLNFMQAHGYSFTYHEYEEMDEQSRLLGTLNGGLRHVSRLQMLLCCWPGCLTVMYDSRKTGLIQIPDIKKNNDYAMWLQVTRTCSCHLLPQSLAVYRRRAVSVAPKKLGEKIRWQYIFYNKSMGFGRLKSSILMPFSFIAFALKRACYIKHFQR